ncbi:MAG: AAA family ATPase [Bacteroidetes bacterium]|nr:AAA family ATPase [Bacteroidota bacterium]
MKLKKIQIREFRSINDSGSFDVDNITCLVGKNESGKTALLQALYQMNPIIDYDAGYNITHDYPRVDVEDYRYEIEQAKREPAIVAHVKFELDKADAEKIQYFTGETDVVGKIFNITRCYEEDYEVEYSFDEIVALKNLVENTIFLTKSQIK